MRNKKLTKLEISEFFVLVFLFAILTTIVNMKKNNIDNSYESNLSKNLVSTSSKYYSSYIDNVYSNEELVTKINDLSALLENVDNDIDSELTQSAQTKTLSNNITNKSSFDNVFLKTYPVGSIYISYNNTNPGTIFGGTWQSFAGEQTLVGVNPGDADFAAGKTGGSNTKTFTPTGTVGNHTLTIEEIPAHTHNSKSLTGYFSVRRYGTNNTGTGIGMGASGIITRSDQTWSGTHAMINAAGVSLTTTHYDQVKVNATHEHDSVGGNGAHNHTFAGTEATLNVMQPYITVYMWKRIA